MSAWWLLAAFALGWMMCWWTTKYMLSLIFKKGGSPIVAEAIQGLRQDSLIKVRDTVNAELEKRRSS